MTQLVAYCAHGLNVWPTNPNEITQIPHPCACLPPGVRARHLHPSLLRRAIACWRCQLNLYHCTGIGMRSVRADGIHSAAEVFAARLARRAFGRRGLVRTLVEDSYTDDRSLIEYAAFIGYPSGRNETTGHNIRFTVRIEGGSL